MLHYFAYGSNMDEEDLDRWCVEQHCPPVKLMDVSPARLDDFELTFNYFSIGRNCGAANIVASSGKCIYGLLALISESDLGCVRMKEGFFGKDSDHNSYDEISVEVERMNGSRIGNVITYKVVKARERREHQPPKRGYLQLLIGNAKKYEFPGEYIKFLESIETKD